MNIGAAVLQTRNNGTWSGDGLQEYCHRLYEHGYNGPAYDPSAEGLRRLGERYPAVSLHQGFVTPVNVVSLLQEYHEGVAAAAAARASSAAAAVEPSGAVVSLEEEVAAGVAALVKIDIDAYDCAVLHALLNSGYRPFVLVVEINFDMLPPLEFAVHYSPRWQGWKDDCHYGCSVAYATRMLGSFGYVLLQVDGWDALYVRADFAPLFGNVPHDALTVQALRPPMKNAEPIAGWAPPADGSAVNWMEAVHADGLDDAPVWSHCRQMTEVLYNLQDPHQLVEFTWDYVLNMSHYQHTVPFVLSAGMMA